jgi:hypothetical protein
MKSYPAFAFLPVLAAVFCPSANCAGLVDPASIDVSAGSTHSKMTIFAASNLVDGLTNEGNKDSHFGTHWLSRDGIFTETAGSLHQLDGHGPKRSFFQHARGEIRGGVEPGHGYLDCRG